MIRLWIVAPSAVVRAGLESLARASPAIEVIGSSSDGKGLEEFQPDVVLAAEPPEDLLAAPAPAIVLLADDTHSSWTTEALRSGVRAVLPRDATQAEILAAVEAAAAGLIVVHPNDLQNVLLLAPPSAPASQTLSPREVEVLRMLADGLANKTIAWKLGISEHTVKFHVASIMTKLNAGSRTEAVTIGIRQGLILL